MNGQVRMERGQIYDLLALPARNTQQRLAPSWTANWDKAAAIRDERFCRMWEFYLAGSEAAFSHQGLVVFQVQLVSGSMPALDARLHGG
jgi:Mycolic acid cyclopropane synthetase